MADIFVSYTSTDRDWAFWIGQELEKLGHVAHLHDWEISAGRNILAWMDERQDKADCVLAIVSKAYLRYDREWRYVLRTSQMDRSKLVFMVRIEDCSVPSPLDSIKYCDLFDVDEDRARERLIQFLRPASAPRQPVRFPGERPKADRRPESTAPFPGQKEPQSVEIAASAQPGQQIPNGPLFAELINLRSRVDIKSAGPEPTPRLAARRSVAARDVRSTFDGATFEPKLSAPSSSSSVDDLSPKEAESSPQSRPLRSTRHARSWLLFVGSTTALTIWIFPREFADVATALIAKITYLATSLIDLVRSAAGPAPMWRGKIASADIVDASAFSPEGGAPGETILIQIFFHRRSQASVARKRAQEADSDTTRRSFCTFETAVNRGQRLGVKLEAPDLAIDNPEQSTIWMGSPCMCQFSVTLPVTVTVRVCQITANFFLDGVPVGMLKFNLPIVHGKEGSSGGVGLRGDAARHFEYAFLSYSSLDRQDVLRCAQVLEGVGIDFFLDAARLRSGEDWERRLFEEIDRSDVFMLFWSENVERTESKWIEREATYALSRQAASKEQLPCFRPTFLGGGEPNRPPWLPGSIQFDNALRRHLLAARHDEAGS